MKSSVRITKHPETGEVFTKNENVGKDGKVYGFIGLEQTIVDMGSAVGRITKRNALKSFSEESFNLAKDFLKEGTELKGQIIVEETIDPAIHKNGDKTGFSMKLAGKEEDAPICKVNGQPVYRRSVYTEDMNATDTLVQHDNTVEIKAFQQQALNAGALN